MTRKDYILIANAIERVKPYDHETIRKGTDARGNKLYHEPTLNTFHDVIDSISEELQKDNPSFKPERFKLASGYLPELIKE